MKKKNLDLLIPQSNLGGVLVLLAGPPKNLGRNAPIPEVKLSLVIECENVRI